jgi:hypothetical protein
MKWVAISGSWRHTDSQIENDVRRCVSEIITKGDGIVSGGALGVDYIATDEALNRQGKLKILIPSTLDIYRDHYFKRAQEGVVTDEKARTLISQLEEVKRRGFLIEGTDLILNKETYFNRITQIVAEADKLVAFQVNKSEGTQDTIDKAIKKGIPVQIFPYSI